MAVEDGATLGKLLGLLNAARHQGADNASEDKPTIPAVLDLYERLRKKCTMLNVAGADENRDLYHLSGKEAEERNQELKDLD
jgi:salicylate hydroxylase